MPENQNHSGLSSAPPELLYAMVLATRASLNSPNDAALHANSTGITALLRVAEHLDVPEGETSLSMQALVSAATGFYDLEENPPKQSYELVDPDVLLVTVRHPSAQRFLSEYIEREFGWKLEEVFQAEETENAVFDRLDRDEALLLLRFTWIKKRQEAAKAHDFEEMMHISRILTVFQMIEFDGDGHPFIKPDELSQHTRELISDTAFQELINVSLREAIGQSLDFSRE